MAGRAYETARIAELEEANGWSPIRLRFGVQAFGINAWTVHEAGAPVIPEHDERPSGHEELYLVTGGHATFTVEGEQIDAPAGTIVFVRDPAATRGAVAREPDTTVVAVGGRQGEPYRPRAWETTPRSSLCSTAASTSRRSVLTAALDRYEDRSGLFYNLACAEALLGETEAALDHLRAAVQERPSFADAARDDPDLAPLRDDPRFAQVVAPS